MKLPPDPHRDRLVCPLHSCAQHDFQSMRSFLKHVSQCERLLDGDYWCPFHQRVENFWIYEKNSRLRKALEFFKLFGRINHQRRLSKSPAPDAEELEATFQLPPGRYELDKDPKGDTQVIETHELQIGHLPGGLSSGLHVEHGARELHGISRKSLSELRLSIQTAKFDETSPIEPPNTVSGLIGRDLARSSCNTVHNISGALKLPVSPAPPDDLQEADSTIFDQDVPQIDNVPSPISPTSAQSSRDHSPTQVSPLGPPAYVATPCDGGQDCGRWSTLTQNGPDAAVEAEQGDFMRKEIAQICPSNIGAMDGHQQSRVPLADPLTLLYSNTENVSGQHCSSRKPPINVAAILETHSFADRPMQVHLEVESAAPSASKANPWRGENLLKRQILGTRQCVHRFSELVCILNDHWKVMLQERPNLYALSEGLVFESPFEVGLLSLQQCFNGGLPTEIGHFFSLTQMGYACAYTFYSGDGSYAWDGLYKDILRLSHSISDTQARNRFLEIADSLWLTPKPGFGTDEIHSALIEWTKHSSEKRPGPPPLPKETVTASGHPCTDSALKDAPHTTAINANVRGRPLYKTFSRFVDGKSDLYLAQDMGPSHGTLSVLQNKSKC